MHTEKNSCSLDTKTCNKKKMISLLVILLIFVFVVVGKKVIKEKYGKESDQVIATIPHIDEIGCIEVNNNGDDLIIDEKDAIQGVVDTMTSATYKPMEVEETEALNNGEALLKVDYIFEDKDKQEITYYVVMKYTNRGNSYYFVDCKDAGMFKIKEDVALKLVK